MVRYLRSRVKRQMEENGLIHIPTHGMLQNVICEECCKTIEKKKGYGMIKKCFGRSELRKRAFLPDIYFKKG